LLQRYSRKKFLRMVVVDINVVDVIVAEVEVGMLLRFKRYWRVSRNVGKLLFVRRVNRRSLKTHGRPALNWLRYAVNLDNDWVNKSVALVKKLSSNSQAVVLEQLDSAQLKRKLRAKDPEKAYVISSWPVAKLIRRLSTLSEKIGKLVTVPPHYTSSLCPRCNKLMKHEKGAWDRLICPGCGHRDDRDHVAVKNLARTALLLNGFHLLDTHLGKELRKYKQAIDSLTPAIEKAFTQDPHSQGLPLGGERGGSPPQVPPEGGGPSGVLG